MTKLTVNCCGVTMGSGVSNKSGSPKPYAFAQVHYLISAKNFQNDNTNIQKLGCEEKTISMKFDQSLFNAFSSVEFPCVLELHLDADPENPSRNIVCDYKIA